MSYLDGELSLGTTNLAGLLGDGTGRLAIEDAAICSVDMGSSPFGATDLYLMVRVGTVAITNATEVWVTLVSRDADGTSVVPGDWTVHTRTPDRLAADLTAGEWFQPIRVPANAGRYISVLYDCTIGDTIGAGTVQAYLCREIDLPLVLQLYPTP